MNILTNMGAIARPLFAPDDAAVADPVKEEAQTDTSVQDGAIEEGTDKGADDTDKPDGEAVEAEKGKDKPSSALDADGEDELKGASDWPEDWREKLADGDEEVSKLIKRYGSPKAVAKALKEARTLISSGKVRRDMPDPEDADAMKEWRKAEGIPEDPTGYVIPESVKTLVSDDDKPLLADFTEFAHSKNASQQSVDIATEWYFQHQEQVQTAQFEADSKSAEETIEAMRSEYGPEYKSSMQLAKRFMEVTPEIGDGWKEARLPDGRLLGNIPEFIQFAVEQGRAMFGDTAFATADAEQSHNNRKAEIETIMSEDINRYYKEGLDKEYSEILQREEKRRK